MPPISTKRFQISLRKTLDLPLIESGIEIWAWRASIMVAFLANGQKWSKPYDALIDTGAPVSILPPSIWKRIETKVIGESKIAGIVPGASIPVQVAEVTASFMDSNHQSSPTCFKAFLSEKTGLPLIIGFEGILSRSTLHLDSTKNTGYLELFS